MKKFYTVLVSVAAFIACQAIASDPEFLEVQANVFFNATSIQASAGESFLITAKGIVDLSNQNGGYLTEPDGTIAATPPVGSGAFEFFLNTASPTNTDPVQGSRKSILLQFPAHLPGAPYGALVAGFSQIETPSSLTDFPDGFTLINTDGIARAPTTGGYLFFGVNEIFGTTGDNSGSFRVKISRVK